MSGLDFEDFWAPRIRDLWARLIEVAPAAVAVRDNPDAPPVSERAFCGWHQDAMIETENGPPFRSPVATLKPPASDGRDPILPGDWKRRDIIGGARTKGLAPEIVEIVDRMIGRTDTGWVDSGELPERPVELGVAALHLRIAAAGATDEAFRDAALELQMAFSDAWPILKRLREAAERLIEATPDQAGGRMALTAGLRGNDPTAIGKLAGEAWRLAGLPLGGPGKSDEGFRVFFRELYRATRGETHIPGEGALLAEIRNSLPVKRFR